MAVFIIMMQPENGVCMSSDGGSVAHGRIAARAGPAPVLSETSIRRKREHSCQASLDMAAKEQARMGNGGQRAYERTASYMAQTESSLRHASVGSEASIAGSVRRLRVCSSAEPRDEASDVASVASSQWSVRQRRRVGPRAGRLVERPLPAATTTTERAQRIAARTAALKTAEAAGEAVDANGSRLQGNAVVVRGGARVTASRKTSVVAVTAAADDGVVATQTAQRLSLSVSGAASPSVTTVTVSDDDTGELTKSGVSVSLSPITSGARSGRRSLHHNRHSSGVASKSAADFLSLADGEGTGDEYDAQEEPVPRTTQPVNFDGYGSAHRGGLGKGAAAVEKAGRPPLTPRGDASPFHCAGSNGKRGSDNANLDGETAAPATTLTSNTVHRYSSSVEYAQQQQRLQQRRSSVDNEAAAPARGSGVASGGGGGATTIHRVTEGRRSSAEYDTLGRKSGGEEPIDDTPISVLKERANREAARNARRDSDQPVVPRLALGEITAKRDRQRRSSSYKTAQDGQGAYAPDTPITGGSVLSNVTVSSMTDSATSHTHGGGGGGRSGRHHASQQQPTQGENVCAGPSPSTSAVEPDLLHYSEKADGAHYNSHNTSPARAEAREEKLSLASTVDAEQGCIFSTTALATDAPAGGKTAAAAAASNSALALTKKTTMVEEKPASEAAEGSMREASPSPAALGPAPASSAAPVQSSKGNGRKRRAFETTGSNVAATTSSKAPPPPQSRPPSATSKEKAKCCVVM